MYELIGCVFFPLYRYLLDVPKATDMYERRLQGIVPAIAGARGQTGREPART